LSLKVTTLAIHGICRPVAIAAVVFAAAAAHGEAALKIGQAEIIRNEVVSIEGANSTPVNIGDAVVRDEVIQTSADSDARIELIDKTKLTLGPNSILKVDRAVFADESRYKQITVRLSEGVFRFITGHSSKKSYRIETPSAVIGVRGTILDIKVSQNENLVTLQDGQASVCAGSKCTQLTERGHTANVTRNGNTLDIRRETTPNWTFASVCSANSTLCAPLPAVSNLTKRAGLAIPNGTGKAAKAASITRFCPNGQQMIGDKCDTASLPRDTSLPRLTDVTRDPPAVSPPGGFGSLPQGAGPAGLPPTGSPPIGTPATGLPLPGLRR
jgi:hypothetical protein